MKRLAVATVLSVAYAYPAQAKGADVWPTRYLHPVAINGIRAAHPAIEQAQTLAPGEFVLDAGAFPSVGAFFGVMPSFDLGLEVGGSTVNTGNMTLSDAALTGKYRVLSTEALNLAVLASVRYSRTESIGGLGETTNGWIGLPLTFGSVEGLSFDVMPIAEIGQSGSMSNPPGLNLGLKVPLSPSLSALVGDYVGLGGGFTQTVSAGLRYKLGSQATLDLTLLDYKFNTGTPGLQIGTLGLVGYFGGGAR